MDFDRFCVGLLTTKAQTPESIDVENDAIQDAHMSHLADLHDSGHLLAAGPLFDSHFRGMLLFATDVEEARELMLADPAVHAGWFDVTMLPWMVPSGAMNFTSTMFPRSIAQIEE
jgi:uncharacterized protein YciI